MITGTKYGAYLKDPMPRRKGYADKIWVTKGYHSNFFFLKAAYVLSYYNTKISLLDNTLLEYDSIEDINSNAKPKVYVLTKSYYGTGHIIYQGSFFYQSYNTDVLLRYDLHLKKVVAEIALKLPKNDTNEQHCRVYSDHREHVGCVDFNVDENGVWVIYRNGSRRNIYVSKLNVDDLSIQKTVVIKFSPNNLKSVKTRSDPFDKRVNNEFTLSRGLDEILNGFIICGKIYFLQYHGSQSTVIRLMFDLYHLDNKFSYLQSIEFIQPYKKNTQLTYNPYDQKLYAWDSEHLITYSLELVSS